jgi:hypothetical protein
MADVGLSQMCYALHGDPGTWHISSRSGRDLGNAKANVARCMSGDNGFDESYFEPSCSCLLEQTELCGCMAL